MGKGKGIKKESKASRNLGVVVLMLVCLIVGIVAGYFTINGKIKGARESEDYTLSSGKVTAVDRKNDEDSNSYAARISYKINGKNYTIVTGYIYIRMKLKRALRFL